MKNEKPIEYSKKSKLASDEQHVLFEFFVKDGASPIVAAMSVFEANVVEVELGGKKAFLNLESDDDGAHLMLEVRF